MCEENGATEGVCDCIDSDNAIRYLGILSGCSRASFGYVEGMEDGRLKGYQLHSRDHGAARSMGVNSNEKNTLACREKGSWVTRNYL